MAAGNANRVLRAPGRLIVNPTNLSAPDTYGGVEVGRTTLVRLLPLGTGFRVINEGLGEATDVLEGSIEYLFACVLRGWDDDGVRTLLSGGYDRGVDTQHAVYSEPGHTTPGASALPRAVTLLYVPDNHVFAPAVLINRGVPDWEAGATIPFQRGTDLVLPIAVDCVRDEAGSILSVGLLSDLSLT